MNKPTEQELRNQLAELRAATAQHLEDLERRIRQHETDAEMIAACTVPRKYQTEAVLPAKSTIYVSLGAEYDLPETMCFGIPETMQRGFGLERDFVMHYLHVDDGARGAHAVVTAFITGATSHWVNMAVPASHFADPPTVRFDLLLGRSAPLLWLSNPTDREIKVRCAIEGLERPQ